MDELMAELTGGELTEMHPMYEEAIESTLVPLESPNKFLKEPQTSEQ